MRFDKLQPIIWQGRTEPPFEFRTNILSPHTVVMPIYHHYGYAMLGYYSALSFALNTDLHTVDFRIACDGGMRPFLERLFPGVPLVETENKYTFLQQFADKERLTIIDADLFCSGVYYPFFQELERQRSPFMMGCEIRDTAHQAIDDWANSNKTPWRTGDEARAEFRKVAGMDHIFTTDQRWFQAWLTCIRMQELELVFWELVNHFQAHWHNDETVYMAYCQAIRLQPALVDQMVPLYYPYAHPLFPNLPEEDLFNPGKPKFQLAHPCGYPADHATIWDYYSRLVNGAGAITDFVQQV